MSGFIPVLGDDFFYPRKTLTFIAVSAICVVQPIWTVEADDGVFWRCVEEHEGAEIRSYEIVDIHGNKYLCGKDEVHKLGIEVGAPKPMIGFHVREDDGKTAGG